MKFEKGQSFKALVPFSIKSIKVHIDHVLPSIYEDRQLIVYRVFGKHKQWWHELMCTAQDMEWYIEKNSKVVHKKIEPFTFRSLSQYNKHVNG